MPLTNSELLYYDGNVLRLPDDKRSEYHGQVDRLIAELKRSARDKAKIKITKVRKAGSFAKYTILRRTSADDLDVDVVFYIAEKSVTEETRQTLTSTIHELLLDIYPNKSVEDFEIQRKATTVSFVKSGISVDVVPVIEDTEREGYGWQYDLQSDAKVDTCAPCQIQFVRDRKEGDKHYRTLVRLAKRWRTQAELWALKSFTIELIMAHIQDRDGATGSIEQRFRRFLLYIVHSELREEIRFAENKAPFGSFSDPVVILDPVNSQNNVAARITESERQAIVKAAEEAYDTAHFASADGNIETWKEIFGPRFKVEE